MNSQRTTLRNRILAAAAGAAMAIMGFSQSASAVPVQGGYQEDPRCDTLPNQTLAHELGKVGFFPQNEAIDYQVAPATFTVCVPDDGLPNDWIVQMVNLSGQSWTNLFFVADLGMKIGNADGTVQDIANAPGMFSDAFKIDAVGLNANLLNESINPNGIFEPGETWRFNVSNFSGPNGLNPPPIIQTPGKFAGSDPITIPPSNTASILATPVPEPTTVGAIAFMGVALLMRRRPRR